MFETKLPTLLIFFALFCFVGLLSWLLPNSTSDNFRTGITYFFFMVLISTMAAKASSKGYPKNRDYLKWLLMTLFPLTTLFAIFTAGKYLAWKFQILEKEEDGNSKNIN